MIESSRLGLISNKVENTNSAARRNARPEILVHESANSYLTSEINDALDQFLLALQRDAHSQHVPLARIELAGYVDPEEDFEEVVVQVFTNLTCEEALTYWDRLGTLVESWTATLPPPLQNLMREKVAFDVQWDASDPAS